MLISDANCIDSECYLCLCLTSRVQLYICATDKHNPPELTLFWVVIAMPPLSILCSSFIVRATYHVAVQAL